MMMNQMNSYHSSKLTRNTSSSYSVKKTSNVFAVNKSASSHQIVQGGNKTKCWPPHGLNQGLQKSFSTNCVIETKRGFKPSDIRDPNKKQFLTNLTHQIWKVVPVSFVSCY